MSELDSSLYWLQVVVLSTSHLWPNSLYILKTKNKTKLWTQKQHFHCTTGTPLPSLPTGGWCDDRCVKAAGTYEGRHCGWNMELSETPALALVHQCSLFHFTLVFRTKHNPYFMVLAGPSGPPWPKLKVKAKIMAWITKVGAISGWKLFYISTLVWM